MTGEKASDLGACGYKVFRPHDDLPDVVTFTPFSGGHCSESDRRFGNDYAAVADSDLEPAVGIIARHVRNYAEARSTSIPKSLGLKVAADWKKAAAALPAASPESVHEILSIPRGSCPDLEKPEGRDSIAKMLTTLADWFEATYNQEDWVCRWTWGAEPRKPRKRRGHPALHR